MKLSDKRRGEIYDIVHREIMKVRLDIQKNWSSMYGNKLDYTIAQLEIPLAQKLMTLLDPSYRK